MMEKSGNLNALVAGVFALAGLTCSSDAAGPIDPAVVAAVEISEMQGVLEVGESARFHAVARDADGDPISGVDLIWSSSSPNVADVDDDGTVTGASPGHATIRVRVGNRQDEAEVEVQAAGSTEFDFALASHIGGSKHDQVRGVAVGPDGSIYVVGGTDSPDFPVTGGAFQTNHNPGQPESGAVERLDVFVTRIGPGGNVLWSTFIGGPNYDRAYGVAVDAQGFVYVGGRAGAGFPVTNGAFQTQFRGGQEAAFYGNQDGFVCKLTPDGGSVVFCSYFGTNDPRIVRDIAVDAGGDIYIASGYTSGSYSAPVASAFLNSPRGGDDAVVAKIRGDGSAVLWARYIGGSGEEPGETSVRVHGSSVYFLTTTSSANAPATAGAYDRTYGGNGDLFITRLQASNGAIDWATYLGGSENESTETHELAVDFAGNVILAAPTQSSNFPTTSGALQRTYGGGNNDMFVSKISADGSTLLASTFLGGSSSDRPEGVATDGFGNILLTGTTASGNFPTTSGALDRSLSGGRDAVAVILSPDLGTLLYSSYLGGSTDSEFGRTAAFGAGVYAIAGMTPASDFTRISPIQGGYGGGNADGFVARIVRR